MSRSTSAPHPAGAGDAPTTRIAPSADISDDVSIGDGSPVWHVAQIRETAKVGRNCVIGRGAYVRSGVALGDNCKVQNYALIYEPAVPGDGVFIGPAAVLTNDSHPRAINPDGTIKSAHDWEPVGLEIGRGASIGGRATCVAPVIIGAWATVAAVAVVVEDVPDHALMAGVPARRIGWVGTAGVPLREFEPGEWVCSRTGGRYIEAEGFLRKADK